MIDVKKVEDFEKLTTSLDGIATAIQNMPAPSGGGINYSTEEQDTGLKWIDGSVLYQKTFDLSNQTVIDNTWNSDILGTTDIQIKMYKAYFNLGTDAIFPYEYYRSNTEFFTAVTNSTSSDINVRPNMNAGTPVYAGIITIWYTKTV